MSIMNIRIRPATDADADGIFRLYRETARTPGGLAREEDEITADYVSSNLERALRRGVSLVAETEPSGPAGDGGGIVGEIHCSVPEPRVFRHVLSDLTIAVLPAFQGRRIGHALFSALLEHVRRNMPPILRVELVARESNARAVALYEKLGFRREGRMERRIGGVSGRLEADIPMAWLNGESAEE